MTDVETVARAMRVERIAYRNRISKEEALVIADDGRYTDAELLAAAAALAAATPIIEARATAAIVAWLRDDAADGKTQFQLARAIRRGDHLKGTSNE